MEPGEKILRLKKLMGEEAILELDQTISKALKENPEVDRKGLNKKYLFPKIRQHGLKVEVKKRKLRVIQFQKDGKTQIYAFSHPLKNTLLKSIEKKIQENKPDFTVDQHLSEIIEYLYSRGSLIDLDHYSLWINKQIYHWGPGETWKMYGQIETDREITNDTWESDPDFPKISFTLREPLEIEVFCDKFKMKPFDLEKRNSQVFRDALINFLGLDS